VEGPVFSNAAYEFDEQLVDLAERSQPTYVQLGQEAQLI